MVALAGWIGAAGPLHAQDTEDEEPAPPPPVSIGGGLQTSFLHRTSDDADASQHFRVNSLRMYLNGAATSKIKFMVNTDIAYGGSLGAPGPQDTGFQILDAVAQFEMSDTFNVWVGRFLPPSDRANLYGPRSSPTTGRSTRTGCRTATPSSSRARDNGAAWWGPVRQGQAVGGRLRRPVLDRQLVAHRGRPHPGGLLGTPSRGTT